MLCRGKFHFEMPCRLHNKASPNFEILIEGILYVSLHIVEPKTILFLLILCCSGLLRN